MVNTNSSLHKSFFLLLILLVLTAGLATRCNAQETSGALRGIVTDVKQTPLPGATVTAIHLPTNTRYSTVTGNDGGYSLMNLRVGGPYSIRVSYVGMEDRAKEDVEIYLGDPQTMNFVLLDQSKVLQEAQVVGSRITLNANRYGAGVNISREQLRNSPSIGRSLQDFTRLTPQGSKDNTFLGSSFRYNNITVDGAINNDAIGFSPSLGGQTGTSGQPGSSTRTSPFPLDAIQEMQIYLAPYDVKIGNFTGASINAVTRSGTNQLEGSVYAYGRNATITGPDNAGDGQRLPSSFYEYQTGFRFGFPLIKNKLFFFTNEEVDRRQDPILQGAGTPQESGVITLADAIQIADTMKSRYGFDPGSYGVVKVYANSNKYFNRLDWNINRNNQLTIRNNTMFSSAINLERDQMDFRFSSIGYKQVNILSSTVLELKSRINNVMTNSLVLGFSYDHDYRDPYSNPNFPQLQIVGETPGTTIYFGTDREGAVFNQTQKALELTDNFVWQIKNHTVTFGTHNERYNIDYGFVNSFNGRVDYLSINDFLNNNPYRVRGSYNYLNNTRDYLYSHPSSKFAINFPSVYVQDEIRINERLTVTPGVRVDFTFLDAPPVLGTKTQNAPTDPYIGNTYSYAPLNQITNHFLRKAQASPRLGFRWALRDDQRLVLKGGVGLFTGRIPLAWLGYVYYNTGTTFGYFDKSNQTGNNFIAGTDPLRVAPGSNIGIAGYLEQNGVNVHDSKSWAYPTQVDAVDNNFTLPKVVRTSLALEDKFWDGYYASIEGIYTNTLADVKFQDVNLSDNPSYYVYDLQTRKQPIFTSKVPGPFSNAYELSNTDQGYRYSLTAQLGRKFSGDLKGLEISVAYTYGESKDISNGVRNSLESNWQLNQALNPNNPGLANSNFEIKHRILAMLNYRKTWDKHWSSSLSLVTTAQSGSPFTYGFVNFSIQGTSQQTSLAYIPRKGETYNFFQDYADVNGKLVNSFDQAAAFDAFIDGNKYLSSRRGDFTERNAAFTPWNVQADMRFLQDYAFDLNDKRKVVTFTLDIVNLTNLIDKNWGHVYFVPNTFNSTASVGLFQTNPPHDGANGYPVYQWSNPGKPYSTDFFASRYQLQLGMRYTF
ncbi:MAG TPA: carboxypeptidase regulatory-like domain-containing protein [Puia sp.]|nr:carboxypeptidase regulatory-like domain-containing protein [Puia sp.]